MKYMGFWTWKLIDRDAVLDDKGNGSDEKVPQDAAALEVLQMGIDWLISEV